MIEILPAQSGDALEQLITLASEYTAWMVSEIRARYPDMNIHEFTAEHAYDDLRKKFPGEHVPPDGCLLIARLDGTSCGCIALGRLSETMCEVRTLYVRPEARGAGIAKQLVTTLLDEANRFGYQYARLDTLDFMESAQSLYRAFGFYAIEPYLELSPDLKRHIRFFERRLDG